jgi:hypothetical protein
MSYFYLEIMDKEHVGCNRYYGHGSEALLAPIFLTHRHIPIADVGTSKQT